MMVLGYFLINMSLERDKGFFEPLGSFIKWLTDAYFGMMLVECLPTVERHQAACIVIRIRIYSDSESGLESGN